MSAPNEQEFSSRLGCSTISFRHQKLAEALATISGLGFTEIDLGALPGVCDHVPYVLDDAAVEEVAKTVLESGLTVRSINGDIGDLNVEGSEQRERHLRNLVDLAVATGAHAVVLPCGAIDHTPIADLATDIATVAAELAAASTIARQHGVEIWVESLHFFRLCFDLERAQLLADQLDPGVGIVMDFSHIVASGGEPADFVTRFRPRIVHVHIRDAVPGNINLSVGNGHVDFADGLKSLANAGYTGHFALELETRDITHEQRPAATTQAAHYISTLV